MGQVGRSGRHVVRLVRYEGFMKAQRRDRFDLGGERNRKQRIPVNSITSKLVLKSIYASGSTGPFFADHYLNI